MGRGAEGRGLGEEAGTLEGGLLGWSRFEEAVGSTVAPGCTLGRASGAAHIEPRIPMISREPPSSGAFVLRLRSLSSCALCSEQLSLGTATSWGAQGLGLGLGLRCGDKEEGGEESKRVVVLSCWGSSSRRRSSRLAWVGLGGG